MTESELIQKLNYYYDGYRKNQTWTAPPEIMVEAQKIFFEHFGRKMRTYCSTCAMSDINSLLIKLS